MSPGENYPIALATFLRIKERFPDLEMTLETETDHDWFELALEIPSQKGLPVDVHLNLQNGDELTLAVVPFFGEWFPCDDEKVHSDYFDCVVGYLSGEYQVEEHWRGERVVRADLKRPDGTTASSWRTLSSLWPWPSKTILVTRRTVEPMQIAGS